MKNNKPERCKWRWLGGRYRAVFGGFILRVEKAEEHIASLDYTGKWKWTISAPDERVLMFGTRVSCNAAKAWARGVSIYSRGALLILASPEAKP